MLRGARMPCLHSDEVTVPNGTRLSIGMKAAVAVAGPRRRFCRRRLKAPSVHASGEACRSVSGSGSSSRIHELSTI